ncbi:MAG TPA: Wzz/FepE/Etk N-terminal domain-containing protein [Candidatus Acidoferrales bacterium]|nr:Wzz/FepE/Etk N-terminal domain-containing protein [Candidatus Acidoferrales bacterium]
MTNADINMSPEKPLWSVLWARRVVIAVTLVLGVFLSVVVLRLLKPDYTATSNVLLVSDGGSQDSSSVSSDMPTIATSSVVLDRVRQKLHLDMDLKALKKGVVARVSPHSNIMQISFKNPDPQTAMMLSNGIADAFVAYYASLSGRRYDQVTSQLSAELANAKQHLDQLQAQLESSAARRSFDGTDSSLDDITNQLNDLQEQRGVANASLVSDYGELAGLQADAADFAPADRHVLLESDPTFRNLEADVAKNAAMLASMRAEYTDSYPGLAGLEDKVQHEQSELSAQAQALTSAPHAYSSSALQRLSEMRKIGALVAGDRARVNSIDSEIATARQELSNAPGSPAQSVGALRSERDAANAIYQALALHLGNALANRAEATALGAAIVVNYAVSAETGLAGPRTLIVLAAIAVLLAAFGAGYLVEMLDPRLHSRERVELLYGQPVIATLGGGREETA